MTTEAATVWKETCSALGKKFGSDVVNQWLSKGKLGGMTADAVELELPTKLHVLMAETVFQADLVNALASYLGAKPAIRLTAQRDAEQASRELAARVAREIWGSGKTGQTQSSQHPAIDDLLAFVDDKLDAGLREALEAHLNLCLICENQVAALRAGKQAAEQVGNKQNG